jgi:hypothetical protein
MMHRRQCRISASEAKDLHRLPPMTQLTIDGTIYEVLSIQTFENDPTVTQVFKTKRPRGRRTYNVWLLHDGSYKVAKF